MNCKKGDLAVVVRSDDSPEHVGLIVRVVSGPEHFDFGVGYPKLLWRIESSTPMRVRDPRFGREWSARTALHPDAWLRPIRDNDGEDETLTWAPRRRTAEENLELWKQVVR